MIETPPNRKERILFKNIRLLLHRVVVLTLYLTQQIHQGIQDSKYLHELPYNVVFLPNVKPFSTKASFCNVVRN